MGLKLGNIDINKLYLGSTELQKVYLGTNLISGNTASSVQLLTADASSLDNDANDVSQWSDFFNSVETVDTNGSTYAYRISGSSDFRLGDLDFTGLSIGDEITISFDAKANTQNEQSISLQNTSNNTNFFSGGTVPLTWTSYSRTVTLTADNFTFRAIGSLGGGVSGDFLLIDNLSIIKS